MNPRVMPKLEFFPRLPAGACGHRCSRKRTEEPALESEARPGVLPSGGRAPPAPGTGRIPAGRGEEAGFPPAGAPRRWVPGAPAPLPRPARHAPGGSGLPAGLPPVWTRAPAAQTPRRRPVGVRGAQDPTHAQPVRPPPGLPIRRLSFHFGGFSSLLRVSCRTRNLVASSLE